MKVLKSWSVVVPLALVLGSTAVAEVPTFLSYAGRLTRGEVPVEGYYDMAFELYDAESGGVLVWSEQHPDVDVVNGLFAVELGGSQNLAESLGGDRYWLQVVVEGTPMLPRAAGPRISLRVTTPRSRVGS
ncbi:MAG: hypothetical protein JW797_07760 [Bradymonadales bacterium]|nr:hypothetical protein [Bradymonadales bacterium]